MQRLSKLIAAAGITSRRKAADLVRAGRVRVDGEVADNPALEVDPARARVEVDGRAVRPEPKRYFVLNKPRGPLSTVADDRGRRTVLDLLGDVGQRLYPVGRLDADTEGLLLLTNDGDLAHRLTHPRHGVEKAYEAEVRGRPARGTVDQLERGVMLPEGPTGAVRVRMLRPGKERTLLAITVHAGRKRMIRRMLRDVGHPVLALRRTRIGSLSLGDLPLGRWRALTEGEVEELRSCAQQKAAPDEGRPNNRCAS
jgi:23S rRNA pseudouridine2605 synthase